MSDDIYEIRRRNLDSIVGKPGMRGRIIEFATKFEVHENWVSQVLRGARTMGEKAARNIERKTGLPRMALDHPDGPNQAIADSRNKLRTDQMELLEMFEQSNPEVQRAILLAVKSLSQISGGDHSE